MRGKDLNNTDYYTLKLSLKNIYNLICYEEGLPFWDIVTASLLAILVLLFAIAILIYRYF
jgi:hypothetical protein